MILLRFSAGLSLFLFSLIARGEGIPAGYEVGEGSTSPNGRLAVLYPKRDQPLPGNDYPPNLLVQLDPYRVITQVGSTGLPRNVTTELSAHWSGDELVAISEVRKWGLLRLSVYELAGGELKRVHPVGDEARKIFEKDLRARLLKKYPKEGEYFAWVSEEGAPDFVFEGRTLRLNLFADNKPNLAGGPHWTARLKAVWNFDTGKFSQTDFQPGKIEIREQL